jgi:hypothetical protein
MTHGVIPDTGGVAVLHQMCGAGALFPVHKPMR